MARGLAASQSNSRCVGIPPAVMKTEDSKDISLWEGLLCSGRKEVLEKN